MLQKTGRRSPSARLATATRPVPSATYITRVGRQTPTHRFQGSPEEAINGICYDVRPRGSFPDDGTIVQNADNIGLLRPNQGGTELCLPVTDSWPPAAHVAAPCSCVWIFIWKCLNGCWADRGHAGAGRAPQISARVSRAKINNPLTQVTVVGTSSFWDLCGGC